MGFQKIDPIYLEYGKEYKIGDQYRGIYKGIRYGVDIPDIGWVEFDDFYSDEFECDFDIRIDNSFMKISFSPDMSFYEFFSEKEAIQACMEYRAVNLILRKVIGDDTFSW